MASPLDKRLKRILVKTGCVTKEEADEAFDEAKNAEGDQSLADILIERGTLDEKILIAAISKEMKLPPIDVNRLKVPQEVTEALPKDLATYYKVVPVSKIGDMITLAVANPFDILKLDDLKIVTGCEIRPVVSTERAINGAIAKIYDRSEKAMEELMGGIVDPEMEMGSGESEEDGLDLSVEHGEDSPVVKMVNVTIFKAIKTQVSDIHIEPMEKKTRIRFRTDGILKVYQDDIPKKLHNAITSRIKILSGLDIAERRIPQDGKFHLRMEGRKVDFRVSTLPLTHGEKTVLRILDSSNLALDLGSLGFTDRGLVDVRAALENPYGMVLVTGPTGSGKTTTLYSALREVMNIEDNVITVEDPVEYQLPGVNQVPVSVKRGLTFAAALRSILRQDPDTIMIGEIRDRETVEIAIKAALTGHLLISTLHTNDSASTVTRMIDMGCDPFMVTSACILISAQRLMRAICQHCKEPIEYPKERLIESGFTEEDVAGIETMYEAKGCGRCAHGYKGRFAIIETMPMSDHIKRQVLDGKNDIEIKYAAVEAGMETLRRCACMNAAAGRTTIDEIVRVTKADDFSMTE